MAEDRVAQRVLDALEAYLAGIDPTRAVRKAFLAGVAVGRALGANKVSTESTGRSLRTLNGKRVPPLKDPPFTPTPLQILSIPDPDPDPEKSIECANSGARDAPFFLTAPVPAPRRARPRCPIPEELRLTVDLRQFAEAGGLDAGQEFGAFKDHYRATGTCFADWPAAFKSWCRKSFEFRARTVGR